MPSLSAFYAPFPWLEADAFVKRSYRLPSFNDLYYSLMGNSRLEPESAFQTGLNLRLHFGMQAWNWSLHLSPYYNRVSNKIVAIPTSSQFRWTMLNLGLVDIAGADVKGVARFRQGDWSVTLTLRYSLQRALDHSTRDGQTWGNQVPYIPLHPPSQRQRRPAGRLERLDPGLEQQFLWRKVGPECQYGRLSSGPLESQRRFPFLPLEETLGRSSS